MLTAFNQMCVCVCVCQAGRVVGTAEVVLPAVFLLIVPAVSVITSHISLCSWWVVRLLLINETREQTTPTGSDTLSVQSWPVAERLHSSLPVTQDADVSHIQYVSTSLFFFTDEDFEQLAELLALNVIFGATTRGRFKCVSCLKYTLLCFYVVFQDVSRTPISPDDSQILTVISYLGCGISSIFLGITLLTYLVFEWVPSRTNSNILTT